MIKFRNFTSQDVVLNDGTVYKSEGVARVEETLAKFDKDKICNVKFGKIVGLPRSEKDTYIIVSETVLIAKYRMAFNCPRTDLVAPAINHPKAIKNSEGVVVSVPGFIWN